MKRFIAMLLAGVMAVSLAGCSTSSSSVPSTSSTAATSTSTSQSPVAGKKVAYILNLASSDIFQLCADQCVKTAKALGMTCDVYFTGGDDSKWQDDISTCAAAGYDGLFVSHGGQNYAYTFLSDIVKKYPKLKIATFDTQFKDENGNTRTIDGITQFFQSDADYSRNLLAYIGTLVPDKKPVKVLKVWVGPNYISPFDRREVGYAEYEKKGLIKTVETIGPTDLNNAESSMYDVMTATLAKYKEGDIDAIWVTYDAYARGCYKALKESGKKIPMVSVDICNTDIQDMLEPDSQWKACACADFSQIGDEGIRLVSLEMNNQYDKIIDLKTKDKTSWVEMPASLIKQSSLKPDTTLANLKTVADATYGNPDNLSTSDWLKSCIGY
jgi:simple sugar transport system substrate-binding protein